MIRVAARHTVWLALVAVYAALVALALVRLDLADRLAEGVRRATSQQVEPPARDHKERADGRRERGRFAAGGKVRASGDAQAAARRVGETTTPALVTAWRAIRLPLLALLLCGGAVLTTRAASRRRRLAEICRFEFRPSREDAATPYQREKLFDSWHGQLAPRWWTRILTGSPSVALELHQLPDERQLIALAASAGVARSLEGRLSATYPDVSLKPVGAWPAPGRHVIRLKKRRLFVARIQTVKDDEQALVESIVTTMARAGEPATVQLVLTPAPWLAHRLSRRLLKQREQHLTREEHRDRDNIGVDSIVEDKELKGALETQHRSLFWVEIRVTARSREVARALTGLFAEAHSENALVQRKMRLRASLYAHRTALAAPNPVPSFLHGVLSSSELAALWSLPRQRAKTAQIVRSPVGRAPAPPQIARDSELEIMRDERGPVGILAADRKYGLAFIGGQGVGKTSAMARTIAIDARDRGAALIVLDPKHDLAELALSLFPADRAVWYMDLARPEVGINPLRIDAEPSAVADVLLQAMREAHEPGAILAQSDEFLRNAALAVCAVEPEPTLWHMYELLSPRHVEYREAIVERLRHQPGMAAVERYWRTTFPERWMDSRTQMAGQLAAPLNKINRLLATPSVDVALRHPFALDIARVIREREVLVVNGALGEVGEQNAVVVLQLVLQLVHQAMKQQQRLPEAERVRVCLKVDEAHLVLTPSFATMLALHRAAGPLEVAAAWQYSEQVEDRAIRSGLKSLLRSRSMFAMGEVSDAREQAEVAMEVYSDLIRSERDDRERMRFGPDDVVRLPTFVAINSWIAGGARQSAFVARTLPLGGGDRGRREHHLERQRAMGASYPGALADPLVKSERPAATAGPDADLEDGDHSRASQAGGDERGTFEASESPTGAADEEPPPQAEAQEAIPADEQREEEEAPERDTYLAVHREVLRLLWDRPKKDRRVAERLEPQRRDLEIIRALWRYEALLLSQIWREWWDDKDIRAAQQRLKRLVAAGWLRRFRLRLAAGGHQPGYALTRDGFLTGQKNRGPNGSYILPEARWRDRRLNDHSVLVHLLQVNAWVLAYRRLLGEHALDWRGEAEGRLEVPTKLAEGRRVAIGTDDVGLERYSYVRDLKEREFGRVWPDATLALDMPHRGRRFDLMIELDRTRSPAKNFDKFRRYDGLITGWWRRVERYRRLGEPPAVVFVCVDEEHVLTFAQGADLEVTGRLARPGTSEQSWPFPGRERTLFVAERDMHEGSLRAWKLPPEPARGRRSLELREVHLPGKSRGGG